MQQKNTYIRILIEQPYYKLRDMNYLSIKQEKK
jgi:hypothetical protein